MEFAPFLVLQMYKCFQFVKYEISLEKLLLVATHMQMKLTFYSYILYQVADVFSYLQSKFVLHIDEVELIKGELTSREKAEKLIEILLSKKRNFFRHFYNALKYAEYHHLCEVLEDALDEEYSDDESSGTSNEDSEFGDLPDGKNIKVLYQS